MYRIGLLFAATLALGSAMAADVPVKLSVLADGSTVYLLSVDSSTSPLLARIRRVFPAPRTIGEVDGALSEVAWQRIDCRARTSQTDRLAWFTNAEATGEPLQELELPTQLREPVFVRPGENSAFGSILDTVCGTKLADASRRLPPVAAPPVQAGQVPPMPPGAPRLPAPSSPVVADAPAYPSPGGPGAGPAPRPGSQDGPVPPRQQTPPSGPNPTDGMRPPGVGPIADVRPFPDSVFTLGTMGQLAEFVYYDPDRLKVLATAGERMSELEGELVNGSIFREVVRGAIARNDKERLGYGAALANKQAMLDRASLVVERLPQLQPRPISSFRAELYRHAPSGQLILVFRGSQEPLDWFSNIWLGLDLGSIEAPHYDAARRLAEQVIKTGKRPIVVGHSLGGGMAQYVGHRFGLPVVAFNSSPLPARYIPSNGQPSPDKVRLFSAIEYQGSPDRFVTRADPVSLSMPRFAESTAETLGYVPGEAGLKAHQHIVMPVCVISRPEPFRTEEEQAQTNKIVNSAMNPSVLGYVAFGKPMMGAMEKGMEMWISKSVGNQLRTRGWQPDSNQPFDINVSKRMKEVVTDVAIDAFHNTQGAARMGKAVYDSTFGDIWKAAGAFGKAALKVAAKTEFHAMLLPHSMARFNRGMQTAVNDDVFLAQPVAEQCRKTATTY